MRNQGGGARELQVETALKKLRRLLLEVATKAKDGHVPSSLSILDILYVMFMEFIPGTKESINDLNRNRFILSKGHASLGLYVVLYETGEISESELFSFGRFNSNLGGHPDRNKILAIEASTGSLGHGLPQAIGLALGLRIKKSTGHVFVLIGDGEANEGSIWESALLANHHKLGNLTCIIDNNLSSENCLAMGSFVDKFQAFGWAALEINGHDHLEIKRALSLRDSNKPIAIIANTIKGFGIPSMQSNPEWHHKSPNLEELASLLKDLK